MVAHGAGPLCVWLRISRPNGAVQSLGDALRQNPDAPDARIRHQRTVVTRETTVIRRRCMPCARTSTRTRSSSRGCRGRRRRSPRRPRTPSRRARRRLARCTRQRCTPRPRVDARSRTPFLRTQRRNIPGPMARGILRHRCRRTAEHHRIHPNRSWCPRSCGSRAMSRRRGTRRAGADSASAKRSRSAGSPVPAHQGVDLPLQFRQLPDLGQPRLDVRGRIGGPPLEGHFERLQAGPQRVVDHPGPLPDFRD